MFNQFGLHPALLKAVEAMQFSEPTPVQLAAIPPAMEGRDLRVTAKTGSGKTAAFLLPVLHRLLTDPRPPMGMRVLMLLPTRELAQQIFHQVEVFAQFTALRAGLIIGGEDFRLQANRLQRGVDILVATPGRLLEQRQAHNVNFSDVTLLVLDEADRMLDMGFADTVKDLADACGGPRQTLLFSATTGGAPLRNMIKALLHAPLHLQLNRISQLNTGTRQQIITADDQQHKERLVHWLLTHETYRKALIFTNTREYADRLWGVLIAAGLKVYVLHGEKDQKDRKRAIDRLRAGEIQVMVATDVAARGLDIDGLDLIINVDMPRSGDEYVHRIGRTGRADGEGVAISLIGHADWNLMSSIERYLKQRFERRSIAELKGTYQGPKKLKASGKAAGTKKKKKKDGKGDKKPKAKSAPKRRSVNRPSSAAGN